MPEKREVTLDDPTISEGLKSNFREEAKKQRTIRELFKMQANVILDPVKLDIEPPQEILEILKKLKAAGYENPIAFGGALRDAYLKEKNIASPPAGGDIDIALAPIEHERFFERYDTNASNWFMVNAAFAEETANILTEKIDGILSASLGKSDTYREFDACIEAEYQGSDGKQTMLDLCFSDYRFSLKRLAGCGDAPINSIAMDSDGHVYAHPNFEDHARSMVYKFVDTHNTQERAEERFTKLKQKLPELINLDSRMGRVRNTIREITGLQL